MKKILAIILVVAMVLVPVSALAAETLVTKSTINVVEPGAKGGAVAWYNAAGAKQDFVGIGTPTNPTWYASVKAPAGYNVDEVFYSEDGLNYGTAIDPLVNPTSPVDGMYAVTITAAVGYLKITYVADIFAVSGVVVGNNQAVLGNGFGSVAGASKAKSGNLVLTANVKNAYFNGDWAIGTSTVALADDLYVSGTGTADNGYVAASGFTVTVNLAKIYAKYGNQPVYVGAQAIQAGAVIVADVATYSKGMGTVSVQWLSATSVKITATAAKGCKFVGWDYDLSETLLANLNDQLKTNAPVLYLTSIDPLKTQATFEAYFIRTSGDFTTGTQDATGGKSDNPKTGDASNIALWTIVGIIALGGVALASKKVFSK